MLNLCCYVQLRKLHEKGLLQKLGDVEDRLSTYLTGMNQAMDDARKGKREIHVPQVDFDGVGCLCYVQQLNT